MGRFRERVVVGWYSVDVIRGVLVTCWYSRSATCPRNVKVQCNSNMMCHQGSTTL